MSKTIKDLYNEKVWEVDFSPEPSLAFAEGFELGANAVLGEIKKALYAHIDNNDSFHDVRNRIKELKGE